MEKIFYLCDGERENCKKRNCYKNGGDCRHTTDISHAMNFERRGKCKNGSFYEKEDVSRNETSSHGLNKVREKRKNIFQTVFESVLHADNRFVR